MPNALTLTPNGVALFRYPEYDIETRTLNRDVPGVIVATINPYAFDMGGIPHWIVRGDDSEMAVREDQLTPLDAGELENATRGFVTAMLWADAEPINMDPEIGERGGLESRKPTSELRERARLFCARFLATAQRADIEAHLDALPDPDGGHPAEYVGHTFYLTAAGHGVSFTDRAWRDDNPMTAVCKRLDDVARTFGEIEHLSAYELADGTVDVDG
jgi:hypothetical protein